MKANKLSSNCEKTLISMNINIGGLQKFSLSDYPKKTAAIIFLRGCNFRCTYCHNASLFDTALPTMPHVEIFQFLTSRQHQLDGVVITGGEPTLYDDLPLLIKKIKSLHYSIKLNTNGSQPDRLEVLIQKNLLNYITMDIKSTFNKYSRICQKNVDTTAIQRSIDMITGSNIPHEFRTTVDNTGDLEEDIQVIKGMLPASSQHYINKTEK
jgi:pyruvate formate lyase activating enzyme